MVRAQFTGGLGHADPGSLGRLRGCLAHPRRRDEMDAVNGDLGRPAAMKARPCTRRHRSALGSTKRKPQILAAVATRCQHKRGPKSQRRHTTHSILNKSRRRSRRDRGFIPSSEPSSTIGTGPRGEQAGRPSNHPSWPVGHGAVGVPASRYPGWKPTGARWCWPRRHRAAPRDLDARVARPDHRIPVATMKKPDARTRAWKMA